jgi:hypothetical protein
MNSADEAQTLNQRREAATAKCSGYQDKTCSQKTQGSVSGWLAERRDNLVGPERDSPMFSGEELEAMRARMSAAAKAQGMLWFQATARSLAIRLAFSHSSASLKAP